MIALSSKLPLKEFLSLERRRDVTVARGTRKICPVTE